ncbi:TPA: bacteriohemerythrin [Pseudomonas aeruginosa]|uniref:bacteriohemerythrin n=1 Tax=Pseudomonas aeruginosa TaxID=287 RepID=UPI0005B7E401|nr:bacteriohemerythrin [Pseudomonas aeruginosa]
MAYLEWSDDLDTGIAVIDDQHKRIVVMINRLDDAQRSAGKVQTGAVIDELIDYTVSHFAFEEAMIEEAGYVFTKAHKRVHALFIRRVEDYRVRFGAGEDIADELKSMLGRWLFSHIRSDDRNYVAAVNENLRRLSTDVSEGGWLRRAGRRFFRGAA